MKKTEAQASAGLIVIAIVVYPFVWLYEHIGLVGLLALVALLVAGIMYGVSQGKKTNSARAEADQSMFETLALHALHYRMSPDEARSTNLRLARKDHQLSELLRNIQILRDSIDISLSSKKRDTAESRMSLATDVYRKIMTEQAHLVSPAVISEIQRIAQAAESKFHTCLYINVAEGYVEKAGKLKTEKSKLKHLALAKEVLQEGIQHGRGDIAILEEALKKTEPSGMGVSPVPVRKG